jgi:lipopolysaccharide/colanic/teichoic acid biosynthesis glycosyltransferase
VKVRRIMQNQHDGLSKGQSFFKRFFDIVFSGTGLILTSWIIILSFLLAAIETQKSGFFTQIRVGRHGRMFKVIKIRTMRENSNVDTSVTSSHDPRITKMGRLFRKTKIDELPQLVNVFLGKMSFVGPRPDVPGYADRLNGEDKIILTVRPGITGPATLKYSNEEEILAEVKEPEKYNEEIIYPDKVRLNKEYIENYSLLNDLRYIAKTIFGVKPQGEAYVLKKANKNQEL